MNSVENADNCNIFWLSSIFIAFRGIQFRPFEWLKHNTSIGNQIKSYTDWLWATSYNPSRHIFLHKTLETTSRMDEHNQLRIFFPPVAFLESPINVDTNTSSFSKNKIPKTNTVKCRGFFSGWSVVVFRAALVWWCGGRTMLIGSGCLLETA